MEVSEEILRKFYSDNKTNGTLYFYEEIRKYIKSHYAGLNLGAGDTSDNKIRSLKGEIAKVSGADIDPLVYQNKDLDEASIIEDGLLSYEDNSFDIVWSDYVLEHVEIPELFLQEVYRVLKQSGRFYFRTPNIFHYVSIISYLTPHKFHLKIANKARGLSDDAHAPYKTFYRMNSKRCLSRLALGAGFSKVKMIYFEGEPSYFMFNRYLFYLGALYERLVNNVALFKGTSSNLIGYFEK